MNDASRKLFEKATRAIHAAEQLLQGGDAEFAIGRAYYAMFYIAEALLNEKGLHFSKHSGVHGAFGVHFAKTGIIDPKYHRWLLESFNKRVTGDYGIEADITPDEVTRMIVQAREFLNEAQQYLVIHETHT